MLIDAHLPSKIFKERAHTRLASCFATTWTCLAKKEIKKKMNDELSKHRNRGETKRLNEFRGILHEGKLRGILQFIEADDKENMNFGLK